MRVSGLLVMILGIIMIILGGYVVATFPWDVMQYQGELQSYKQEIESEPVDEWLKPFVALIKLAVWAGYTFIILIASLFISGIALIASGYAIMTLPETKGEDD